ADTARQPNALSVPLLPDPHHHSEIAALNQVSLNKIQPGRLATFRKLFERVHFFLLETVLSDIELAVVCKVIVSIT
ncbi:MAG TPA: hypothetical protein PK677_17220, partial [Acidiphilium sp.]|nr:hypothetical protein [Acidiphilium sp.]